LEKIPDEAEEKERRAMHAVATAPHPVSTAAAAAADALARTPAVPNNLRHVVAAVGRVAADTDRDFSAAGAARFRGDAVEIPGVGEDGGFQWSNFVSSPTNIAIGMGILTVLLVLIYCLVKLVIRIMNWFWECMLRTPCCLSLKWVWVPACKSLRRGVYEVKQCCHDSCIACDECCHPWKKMELA
jgi:hypothetical protein